MQQDGDCEDGPDYVDRHFAHRVCMRPGDAHGSPIWNTHIKPLVDPFADDHNDFRFCDEEEFHELIWEVWRDAGIDNDVTIDHEQELSVGSSEARGSRIDFRMKSAQGFAWIPSLTDGTGVSGFRVAADRQDTQNMLVRIPSGRLRTPGSRAGRCRRSA
ncbi:hypothetical protein [Nocardia australiensis]|uniref:hypothetical protein n=1 Tax=Nocardia australiensis TaxID=2887191 RepID=UPI001D13CAA5|nr:hypothetical protein [Nocardia australiensis]